jgi:hypothetical protein
LQSFMSVLRKIGKFAGKGVDVGRQLGLLQSEPAAASQDNVSEMELQSFMSVLRKIGRFAGKGVDAGRQLGLLQSDPVAASANSAMQ